MNLYAVLLSIACMLNAGCAGALYASDPAARANRLASLLFLGTAWWAGCEVVWNLSTDADVAIVMIRASTLGWVFIGPLVLHTFVETSSEPTRLRRLIAPLYIISCLFLAVDWTTPWMHRIAIRQSWGWVYEIGPAHSIFYLFTMIGVIPGVYLAMRLFGPEASPAEQRLRPWLFVGIGVPVVVASITDAVLPMVDYQPRPLGTISIAMLGVLAVWTTLRYGHSFLTPGNFSDEILSTLTDGVALLHRNGRIRSANQGLARLAGRSQDSLEGMQVGEIFDTEFGDPPGPIDDVETRLRLPDNSTIPVSVAASVLCDADLFPVGLVVVARDLREVSTLRNRLITSARLAAVGQLAAGIAHEINNPIAFVRANLTQLDDAWKGVHDTLRASVGRTKASALSAEATELVTESLEGIDRAAAIVRGVRGFSHAGTGTRVPTDLNAVLEDVLLVAATQLRWRITVERVYADVPLVRIAPQELKQVFLNLVVNAGQAVDDGGHVRIATSADSDHVYVDVEDDGCGIEQEDLERIFDPFFTTKEVGEGTGLGLGIAYQIVMSHEGEITVDSEPGVGTRFRVRLPAHREA